MRRKRREFIRVRAERKTRQVPRSSAAARSANSRMSIQARAYRRSADRQIIKAVQRIFKPFNIAVEQCKPNREISWPTVSGVASCRCVRPILTTS